MKKLVTLLLLLAIVFNLLIMAFPTEVTASNLPQLGSATELTWGLQRGWYWDTKEEKPVYDPKYDAALPGVVSFKRATSDQGRYEITLNRVGEEHALLISGWDVAYSGYDIDWVEECFVYQINESGDYYFTVTAIGDGVTYANGPTVKSDVWSYVKPGEQLPAPTQLTWDWPYATFNSTAIKKDIFCVGVDFYYTDNLEKEPLWMGYELFYPTTDKIELDNWYIQSYGSGYYAFKVQLLSNDITKNSNSAWSAMSPVYHLTEKDDAKPEETPEVKPEEKPEDKPEEKPEDKPVVNFKDVPSNAFYYDPVLWAVENGVTTGTSATTFSPDEVCTRGQVVTFLWRAAGQPEPKNTTNPFTDVKEGDFFYKAVLWAVENKITNGTGDGTTFSPNENCNRGQIVTFLSRAKGGKATTSTNPFKDVAENAFYYNPVLWAVEKGITTGTGDGTTFAPNEDCTRGQVITFLYRAYK